MSKSNILIDPRIVPWPLRVEELVNACARGDLHFDELCERVADMGYKTALLHELVHAAEKEMNA